MNAHEAHRRALADVNGDPRPRGWIDLVSLFVFVWGVIMLVALLSGHIVVSIK